MGPKKRPTTELIPRRPRLKHCRGDGMGNARSHPHRHARSPLSGRDITRHTARHTPSRLAVLPQKRTLAAKRIAFELLPRN